MSITLDEQINQLKQTIADIESQRSILGDEAVEASIRPIRQKLADLEAQAEPPKEAPSEVPVRQRKLVTLLYMDVVGSTAMTQHLDPEDTLEIMDNALPKLAAPIEAHGGHVTRYTGDGFKAVLGDPVAREDDPEQAIRAGLEILALSQELAKEIEKEWGIDDFQVRIGIDTGLAALGGQTEAEDTVMGRVVNLAVRIESAAPPGGLLISHNTYRHVRGVFTVEPQEPITAKGFPHPVEVYLVKEIKPRAFRVQTRGVEGIETRMVGRNDELRFLRDSLMTAFEEGEGHVVTVSGEAGVGKSRLLYEFQNWLDLLPSSQAVRFFQGRGRQEAQGSPYSLLRDVFAFRFQILDDDTGEQARRKIEAGFGEVFGDNEDGMMRAHIIGQLLGFDFSASHHLKSVLNDAEQLRDRSLMYLQDYFQSLSQESPVVVILEDIHWADDSSLNAVDQLGEFISQLRLLIICAARPTLFERRPDWSEEKAYRSKLELHPLTERDSIILIEEILKLVDEIPDEMRETMVNRAEGNPFYMEEMIKMLIEDGVVVPSEETWRIESEQFSKMEVPATLVGVLQARLESLPPGEREILQQASVVGRLFWDRLVAHLHEESDDRRNLQFVPIALTSLRGRELIYRHEESAFEGALEYLFKHDVLREVTYESVLKRLRKTYHGLVADWLIVNSGERISEYLGLIGEHFLLAGREGEAGKYFFQAGEAALASAANSEAERFYSQVLELSPAEDQRADSLSGLGEALSRLGQTDDAKLTWRDTIDLYQELGDRDQIANVYAKLSNLLREIGFRDAWEICQEGLELMKGAPDSHGYARLLAEAGRAAHFNRVSDQIMPLCQRAQEMAARVGALEAQADASITLAWQVDNIEERITLIEKVIKFTEENGLLRIAAFAHSAMSWIMNNLLIDVNAGLLHSLSAARYYRQIGQTEFTLGNLISAYRASVALGNLKFGEVELVESLHESNISEKRKEKFFLENRHFQLDASGEWILALEEHRQHWKKLRQRARTQETKVPKLRLAATLLELNRFEDFDELSEAETVLKEEVEYNWYYFPAPFLLTIVYARQGLITEARRMLKDSMEKVGDLEINFYRIACANAQFEIAYAEGLWEEAVENCKMSIEAYKDCGHRWGWARRLIDLGDALVLRSVSGDLEQARETYQQSLDMFTEMGAPGYIKVLEERLGNL